MKPTNLFCSVSLLVALVALSSGCAFSKTPVTVDYKPAYRQPLQAAAPATLRVAEFKDSRPVGDGNVLLQKANAYGTTSGAWVAQRPVAELLRDVVADALKANDFKVSEAAGKYELRGELQEFGFSSISGVWTAKVKPRMQVRFELVDKASGNAVWRDTYIGRGGDLETAWGGSEMVISLFKIGAEDIVRQLVSDPAFRKPCEGQ